MAPICISCRREIEEPEPDSLEIHLEGPAVLAAIRETPRETLTDEQRELVERFEASLCPSCGRAL